MLSLVSSPLSNFRKSSAIDSAMGFPRLMSRSPRSNEMICPRLSGQRSSAMSVDPPSVPMPIR